MGCTQSSSVPSVFGTRVYPPRSPAQGGKKAAAWRNHVGSMSTEVGDADVGAYNTWGLPSDYDSKKATKQGQGAAGFGEGHFTFDDGVYCEDMSTLARGKRVRHPRSIDLSVSHGSVSVAEDLSTIDGMSTASYLDGLDSLDGGVGFPQPPSAGTYGDGGTPATASDVVVAHTTTVTHTVTRTTKRSSTIVTNEKGTRLDRRRHTHHHHGDKNLALLEITDTMRAIRRQAFGARAHRVSKAPHHPEVVLGALNSIMRRRAAKRAAEAAELLRNPRRHTAPVVPAVGSDKLSLPVVLFRQPSDTLERAAGDQQPRSSAFKLAPRRSKSAAISRASTVAALHGAAGEDDSHRSASL